MVFKIKIKWKELYLFLISFGYGITIHAIANELWRKAGYFEILKPQGEWIGFFLSVISFLLFTGIINIEKK